MMGTMYFITAICNDNRSDYFRSARCFGYYKLALDAVQAVLENRGDMEESLYTHIVIERVGEGIHPIPDSEIWYMWQDEKWQQIPKPEWSKGTINWCIG